MISNPANPTHEEIYKWAYSDQENPDHEWELLLIWKGEFETYLQFAADINCPKENFFLDLLYYWVWRNIKHQQIANDLYKHQSVFNAAEKINTPYVKMWLDRSKRLMQNQHAFTENEWFADRRPYDF